jgi:UDP-glucose 4-epimerase
LRLFLLKKKTQHNLSFYRITDRPPRTTSDPVSPTLVYARHKVECEELIRESGLDWCILRPAAAPAVMSTKFDPFTFHTDLDARVEFVHPSDVGLAITNAVDSGEAWRKVLLVGGGSRCQIYYRDLIRQTIARIGGFPDGAFAPSGSSSWIDWVDTSESQRILSYQRNSIEDFVRDQGAALGLVRYAVPLLAPVVRNRMLRQSPFYRTQKCASPPPD